MSDVSLTEEAERALRMMERDNAFHDEKNRRIVEQQRAYEGILRRDGKPAADWESHLHPPLINHAIETAMVMLIEDDIKFDIEPIPKEYKGAEWDEAVDGAQANEWLFERQMGSAGDRFAEFQRPFVLQAAINRVSIAKTHWRYDEREVKFLDTSRLFPLLGRLSPVKMKESTKKTTLFNGPITECVDLRDFYWPEGAVSLDVATYAAHAIWMYPYELQEKAKAGVYSQAAVDALLAPTDEANAKQTEYPSGSEIELDREKRGRKNGKFEVLEVYDRATRKLYVIGGRNVLLLEDDWPFWHQDFPFVAMSLAPFPFSIQGLSLVEKLAPMQDAYWDLLNQTFDNNKLINNAIILMASDFDDPDAFEYAPGAVNTVDNPQQVVMWSPNVQLAQVAAPLMDKLQTDIGNLAMGQPLTIPMSGRVTATEIATLSQIAQNAAQKMKDQVVYAYQRVGYQRMRLNQQFIRDTQHFIKRGPDGDPVPLSIPPHVFQGDYAFKMKPSPDSSVRAERRSEKQQLATWAMQAAPVWAMAGTPLNLRAFSDEMLEAYDIDNKDEFYSAKPQAPPAPPGQQPPGQPEGVGPGGQPVGVTGENSINPAVSPSHQSSLAPGVAQARALASQGGLMNNQLPGAK